MQSFDKNISHNLCSSNDVKCCNGVLGNKSMARIMNYCDNSLAEFLRDYRIDINGQETTENYVCWSGKIH